MNDLRPRVNGRYIRRLRPISELELRLRDRKASHQLAIRETYLGGHVAYVAHVEQFPALGPGVILVSLVLSVTGSTRREEG